MKIAAFLSCSALFMATLASAVAPNDPNKIDTCVMPGVVAYTFDDGPGAYNDKLLSILAAKNVKATFFVLGSMIAENPGQAASLKKMLDAGHQLASHTYSHSNLDNMTDEKREQEMTSTSDLMFKHAGVRPRYMRAPEGSCAEACTKFMTSKGLVISHWNVDTNDWRFMGEKDPEVATANSMKEINDVVIAKSDPKTDSFILLQHEIHKFSVDLLADRVIDAILKKGYRFVTMEECVGQKAYLDGSVVPPPGTGVPSPSGTTPVTASRGVTVAPSASGAATSAAPTASGTGVPDKAKPASGAGSTAVAGWTAFALGAAALSLAMI